MRLPFNTTCDLFAGVGTATPGVYKGTYNCRYVVEDGIFTIGPGVPDIPGYMTIDATLPVGSFTFPQLGLDPSLSDTVAIPSGTAAKFWVIYTDQILWKWHTPYYRAYLCRLPIPSGKGGVILNSTALRNYLYTYNPASTGSAGVLLGGSGIRGTARDVIGSGGVLLAGRSGVYNRKNFLGSGGVLLSGGALYGKMYSIVGSGGILLDSSAAAGNVREYIGSGGIVMDSAGAFNYIGSGDDPDPPPLPNSGISAILVDSPLYFMRMITTDALSPSVGWKMQVIGCVERPEFDGLWLVTNVINPSQFYLGSGPPPASGVIAPHGKVFRVG